MPSMSVGPAGAAGASDGAVEGCPDDADSLAGFPQAITLRDIMAMMNVHLMSWNIAPSFLGDILVAGEDGQTFSCVVSTRCGALVIMQTEPSARACL